MSRWLRPPEQVSPQEHNVYNLFPPSPAEDLTKSYETKNVPIPLQVVNDVPTLIKEGGGLIHPGVLFRGLND